MKSSTMDQNKLTISFFIAPSNGEGDAEMLKSYTEV